MEYRNVSAFFMQMTGRYSWASTRPHLHRLHAWLWLYLAVSNQMSIDSTIIVCIICKPTRSSSWLTSSCVDLTYDFQAQNGNKTETSSFQSETRPRPRPSQISLRPRLDRNISKVVSRPRLPVRHYVPGMTHARYIVCLALHPPTSVLRCQLIAS